MLENCTILDVKTYEGENKFRSRKAAKISTYKVFYPKTKEIMAKLRNDTAKVEPELPTPAEAPSFTNTEVKGVENQVNTAVNTTVVNEESTVKFLSNEEYENILNSKNVVCFNDLKGNNKSVAGRKLRVVGYVKDKIKYVSNTMGSEYPVLNKEETRFDFSQFSNVVPFPGTGENKNFDKEPETKANFSQFSNVVPFPGPGEKKSFESKPTPSIDDYFQKENIQLSTQGANDISVSEIAELQKANETLKESIETQKEILKNLLQKQEMLKIQRATRKQELTEQKLALTQELNDLLAEINQVNDIVNEEETSLGLNSAA